MRKNVFAICVLVSLVALFASCSYRYNKEKMQEDFNQAIAEGDAEKAAQLEARIEELTETEVSAMTVVDEVVDYFSYKLNIDRMLDDFEQAVKDGNEEQKEYLLNRLSKLYYDPNSAMNSEQMERLEDYIGANEDSEDAEVNNVVDVTEEFDYSDYYDE